MDFEFGEKKALVSDLSSMLAELMYQDWYRMEQYYKVYKPYSKYIRDSKITGTPQNIYNI